MANYTIPRRRTHVVETHFGIDADGHVVVAKVYEHSKCRLVRGHRGAAAGGHRW